MIKLKISWNKKQKVKLKSKNKNMRPESFQAGGEKSEKKLEDVKKEIWRRDNLEVARRENKKKGRIPR